MLRRRARHACPLVAIALLLMVSNAQALDRRPREGVPTGSPQGVYAAFLRDVAQGSNARACALLTSPDVLGYASLGACTRGFSRIALVFAPGALQRAARAGASVTIDANNARATPRAPCLGVALLQRTARGWRFTQPPFAPARPGRA
jgi:hypothetical protein